MEEEVIEAIKATPVRLGEGATGRAATTRTPVQIPDILEEREYTGTRARPMFCGSAIDRSGGSTPPRTADYGGLDRVEEALGKFFAGSRQSSSDVRDSVGPGDTERAALPRDPGKGAPTGAGEQIQVAVPGEHEP